MAGSEESNEYDEEPENRMNIDNSVDEKQSGEYNWIWLQTFAMSISHSFHFTYSLYLSFVQW